MTIQITTTEGSGQLVWTFEDEDEDEEQIIKYTFSLEVAKSLHAAMGRAIRRVDTQGLSSLSRILRKYGHYVKA